ncbi:MAG: 23S rRNA pseudouridine(1911/1915/1917) synthase RluD [Betaproteobacteria bacterium]|nr:23S rRNA pseudouridine(1911/1915/1917) synthase RluD [Betaproteobacteria bacterium]MDE2622317.1 23S rRNA pseudouridine(1911/1915/1917) synthase RluD [Betaproteobacteria bacterium]
MFVIGKFIMLSEDYTSPEAMDPIVVQISQACAGLRLDQALVQVFPEFSRSRLQRWVREGHVLLNGAMATAKSKVWSGDEVTLQVPEEEGSEDIVPQAIALDVVYEDDAILVINKPAGLVVHPGNGNRSGTLQNALLHYDSRLGPVPRCGIVHRLDKDTSGLMVVARTLQAHAELVRQLQARTVHRHYWALVQGQLQDDSTVEAPIGRHPTQRTRMAVVSGGRPAVTHIHVVEHLPCHTWIECRLETGRTHQIRVHLQHLGFPLAGDPVYGGRGFRLDQRSQEALKTFGRQALHAFRLGLDHPVSGEAVAWEIPMAPDMAELITILRGARHE